MTATVTDLFCGAGGAAEGYHRAGFDVVGIDIEPQPHVRPRRRRVPLHTSAGAWLRPQISEAYRTGLMPAMLPALGPGANGRG